MAAGIPPLTEEHLERLPCGVAVARRHDGRWVVEAANAAYRGGIPARFRDAIPGLGIEEFLGPELMPLVERSLREALAEGATSTPLAKAHLPGVGDRWYRWMAVAVDADTVMFLVFDLTELGELRVALRAGEALRAAVVAGLRDPVLILDPDRRVRDANPAAASFFGTALEDTTWDELVRDTGVRRLDGMVECPALSLAEAGELPAPVEINVTTRTAGTRQCRVTFQPVRTDDRGLGVAVVFADMTEELRLARERRLLLERELTASTKARQELASDVHDGLAQTLTELAMVVEAAELAGTTLEPGMLREIVDRSVRECRAIVDDLHDSPVLHGFEAALEALTDEWRDRGVLAARLTGDRLPRFTPWREALLYQVAAEVLRNAVKHGGEPVVVDRRVRDGHAEVAVSDRGPGITPESQRAAAEEGHLGMVLCAERMAALSGTFEVEGSPGAGTTVRFSCPLE